ncbi:UNVERIFIED_CONTAM: BAG family molecular chaperone regulator 2 [Sesamum radiatum]|uniref:BAG family molecular chaperone regulator 2 n=1 Tax=Sesamum radiatum TaxID=300843 RepID=A0AAW2LQJ1_SESRA
MTTATTASSDPNEEEVEWEMRPGGMLVQKRSGNSQVIAPPNLRVRVVYGAARYQISANSQSTFGELKKLLAAETGLEPGEQRLIFRGKERENGEYLDTCGVKDRAKVVLIEDPESKERRLIEMRRNAKIQAIHRLIDDVSTEVDRLAEQVCIIEKSIGNGNKVAEVQITTLMEMLMRQAVKLDSIPAEEGDACVAKKDSEGKRVQKCVETLDVLKESNGRKERAEEAVVVTAKWETFDQSSSAVLTQWELFD